MESQLQFSEFKVSVVRDATFTRTNIRFFYTGGRKVEELISFRFIHPREYPLKFGGFKACAVEDFIITQHQHYFRFFN